MPMREKYKGIQDKLKAIGKDGCYFLALHSIVADVINEDITCYIVRDYNELVDNRLLQEDCTVLDSGMCLQYLLDIYAPGKYNILYHYETFLPEKLEANQYSIVEYYHNGVTHFRRRDVDTLKNSVTVAKGKKYSYRIFAVNAR